LLYPVKNSANERQFNRFKRPKNELKTPWDEKNEFKKDNSNFCAKPLQP
jgi:hypothetical protein